MKNRINVVVFTLFLLINACSNKYNKETLSFKKYMQEQFNTDIEDGNYVLIPLNICHTCIETIGDILLVTFNKKNKIILIDYTSTTINNYKSKYLEGYKVYKDNKMNLVKQNIISGNNIYVFKIQNHKIIDKIKFIRGKNENEIKKFLLK